MNHSEEPVPLPAPQPMSAEPLQRPEDAELNHARDLIARTMRFLSACAEDPEEALRAQDPRQLIRELEVLVQERDRAPAPPQLADDLPEPRTIPLHRRRSA